MVEYIFNSAKVNPVLACLLQLLLSDASTWLDNLAYIKSKTDANNDIEQTEFFLLKVTNYHFNKFSASASLCSQIISAKSTAR